MTAPRTGTIAIVGGYGEVGIRIARHLLDCGQDVVIAGRNEERATATARTLGCRNATMDLQDPGSWSAAIRDAATVVCCVDQRDPAFVGWVVCNGRDYVDITASDEFFRQVESLNDQALGTGAMVVLSVGLAPGMTNLMVQQCARALDRADRAQIAILLGLGDRHGDAAIQWTLERLGRVPGKAALVRVPFPTRSAPYWATPIDIADQHVIQRTLGLAEVRTLVTLESSFWTKAAVALGPALRHRQVRRWIQRWSSRLRMGSESWALAVDVSGARAGVLRTVRSTLIGTTEAEATAVVAAHVVALLPGRHRPGVHHIDQLFSIEDVVSGSDLLRPSPPHDVPNTD